MKRGFVADASAAAAWCFRDEQSVVADSMLRAARAATLYVPEIWTVELANILAQGVKRKRVTVGHCNDFLAMLATLKVQVDRPPQSRKPARHAELLFELAREHKLTSYDACYLDVAMRRGLPLLTLDRELGAAAASVGVAVFL